MTLGKIIRLLGLKFPLPPPIAQTGFPEGVEVSFERSCLTKPQLSVIFFFFHPMTEGSVESEEVPLILKSVGQNRLQKSEGGYFRETVYLC